MNPLMLAVTTLLAPLLAVGAERLWYAAPLIVSISLVYAATRHEETGPILSHAARFGTWIVIFMVIIGAALALMGSFQ